MKRGQAYALLIVETSTETRRLDPFTSRLHAFQFGLSAIEYVMVCTYERVQRKVSVCLGLCVQLIEQRLGIFEVCCIKAFGKPAVDRRKQLAGLLPFALTLPEAG